MNLQIVCLYFSLMLLGIIFQYKLWKLGKFTAFSILHASFVLYYVAIPLVLETFAKVFIDLPGNFTYIIYQTDLNQKVHTFILITIAYFVLALSYFLYNKGILRNVRYKNIVSNDAALRIVYRYGMFFFILGGASIILFFSELGGFKSALRFAETLRYIGTEPSNYYGPLGAMFRMLSFLIMGAAFCFKVHLDITHKTYSKVLFYISFSLSIMYLLFNSGRAPILFFIVPFILSPIIKRNRKVLSTLFLIFIGIFITAEIFDVLLYKITLGDISGMQESIPFILKINYALQDFSFPYANVLYINEMNELFDFRYGQDYFIWIINILPSRIFNLIGLTIPEFDTINVSTTAYYYYHNPNLLGGIPTDLITLGMRQFSIPGLIINSMIFSIFALKIDKLSNRLGNDYNLIIIRIKLLFFSFIGNNDISAFVRNSLFILILLFMLKQIDKVNRLVPNLNHKIDKGVQS